MNLRHAITFHKQGHQFELTDERIENENAYGSEEDVYFYYRYLNGRPTLNTQSTGRRYLQRENVEPTESILSQFQDPELYPELAYLGNEYQRIRLYREWSLGRNTIFREPQRADLRHDRLEEDFSNLGLFLNNLGRQPSTKRALINHLQQLYEGLTGYEIIIEAGTVQVYFTEGDFSIPATRLSDGSLRYLCLLAILLDPTPPPLIGIEEPELGLHPDLLPKIADLLLEAAERTQLLITTHSEILIDALSDQPESVLICEKHHAETQVEQLNGTDLSHWLSEYRLGELWTRGEIGGTRW